MLIRHAAFSTYAGPQLTSLRECSEDEIRTLLFKSPPKTCPLDPVPTDVLLQSVDILLPFICVMCNASLRESVLPSSQKTAIITPVVKKPGLDPDEPQYYRPISNLTFMSKIIERLVTEQIQTHLKQCNLMPSVQSAYRKGHSTETVLVKVIADIIDAADSQNVTLLGLLDMSAAFDTVDHEILLSRLETSYGISGLALQWLRSFITDRTQKAAFAGTCSTLTTLLYGVSQGSVLGPLLFVFLLVFLPDARNISSCDGSLFFLRFYNSSLISGLPCAFRNPSLLLCSSSSTKNRFCCLVNCLSEVFSLILHIRQL